MTAVGCRTEPCKRNTPPMPPLDKQQLSQTPVTPLSRGWHVNRTLNSEFFLQVLIIFKFVDKFVRVFAQRVDTHLALDLSRKSITTRAARHMFELLCSNLRIKRKNARYN
jgi:hypothetical protein